MRWLVATRRGTSRSPRLLRSLRRSPTGRRGIVLVGRPAGRVDTVDIRLDIGELQARHATTSPPPAVAQVDTATDRQRWTLPPGNCR